MIKNLFNTETFFAEKTFKKIGYNVLNAKIGHMNNVQISTLRVHIITVTFVRRKFK